MKTSTKAIVAALATAAVGTVGVVATPARHLAIESATAGCVVPDCRTYLGRGAWDDHHEPVDCLRKMPPRPRQLPGQVPMEPRWVGCTVMPAADAVGAACLPVRCNVKAGVDPTRYKP